MTTRNRYSDEELEEFKHIILDKIAAAEEDYKMYSSELCYSDSNSTDDTSPTFKVLEDGAEALSKEERSSIAERQLKFIQHLKQALVRIENKTYGICRETGQLIPKERLRIVPHATLVVEAKDEVNNRDLEQRQKNKIIQVKGKNQIEEDT